MKEKSSKQVSNKGVSGPIAQHKSLAMGKPVNQTKKTKAPK